MSGFDIKVNIKRAVFITIRSVPVGNQRQEYGYMRYVIRDLPIVEIPYVAIDTETTGLSPRDGHRLVEVAAIRFHRGVVLDKFVTLVNPLTSIHPAACAIHGITDEMVAEAPTFADVYEELVSFLDDDILVFHNAPFDISFLEHESRIIGKRWVSNPVIDTLKLARGLGGRRGRNSLGQLAWELGVGSPCHRAESDAVAAGKILLALSYRGGHHLTASELLAMAGWRV